MIALTATTCKKKRYPKDIPKWLKEKIDKMEKGSKGRGCAYETCRSVKEFTDGSSTYYWINESGTAGPMMYSIYDYNGVVVCIYTGGGTYPPCNNYGYVENFTRLVWEEN